MFNLVAVSAALLLGATLAAAAFYFMFWIVIHVIGLIASRGWTASHMLALRTAMRGKFTQIGVTFAIIAVVWSWVRTATTWNAWHGTAAYPIGTRLLSTLLRVASPEGHAFVMQDETEHPAADIIHDVIDDVVDSGRE